MFLPCWRSILSREYNVMDIKRPSLSTFSTIGRYLKIIFLLCSFKVYFILTIFIFRFCLHFSKAKYNNYSAFISSSVTKNHETARIAIWPVAKNILYIQMKGRYQVEIGRIWFCCFVAWITRIWNKMFKGTKMLSKY